MLFFLILFPILALANIVSVIIFFDTSPAWLTYLNSFAAGFAAYMAFIYVKIYVNHQHTNSGETDV